MFDIKLGNIDKAVKNVEEIAKIIQNYIINDTNFYNEDGNLLEEYAKGVFFKSLNDYMTARMKKKPVELADLKIYIERNK